MHMVPDVTLPRISPSGRGVISLAQADGWAVHGRRVAFERDRARDLAQTPAG
jgi:hypothetical protein